MLNGRCIEIHPEFTNFFKSLIDFRDRNENNFDVTKITATLVIIQVIKTEEFQLQFYLRLFYVAPLNTE